MQRIALELCTYFIRGHSDFDRSRYVLVDVNDTAWTLLCVRCTPGNTLWGGVSSRVSQHVPNCFQLLSLVQFHMSYFVFFPESR